MKPLLLVALGGAFGSMSRYLLSGWILHHAAHWRFPVGTFAINVLGCLVIGALAGLAVKDGLFSPEVRLFLFTGLLGGFTTFSAFGLETFYLIRREEFLVAGGYVLGSVALGLLAVVAGFHAVSSRATP